MRKERRDKRRTNRMIMGRLPMWFWPLFDKIIWPILGLLTAVGLYMLWGWMVGA